MSLLILTAQYILVRHEALESDRSTRVQAGSAHADLRAEAISEAIREARGRVHERARAVDALDELARGLGGCRDDGIGVVRAVRVDVSYGCAERGHGEHGEREVQVFRRVCVLCCWLDQLVLLSGGEGFWITEKGDAI